MQKVVQILKAADINATVRNLKSVQMHKMHVINSEIRSIRHLQNLGDDVNFFLSL